MKTQQQLHSNLPLTSRRLHLQRIGPQHVELLLDRFSNDSFWNAYRVNQPRNSSRDDLFQQLQFEYERLPEQVGKIEWLIERLPAHADSNEILTGEGSSIRPIGLASLSAYDSSKRQAELLIGFFNADDIVTGLGLEASLLILSYAFYEANLKKLLSYVYINNTAAQKSTLALGFTQMALLKSHLKIASSNSYCDVFQNELRVEDFKQNSRLSRLSKRVLGYDVVSSEQQARISESSTDNTFSLNASFKLER